MFLLDGKVTILTGAGSGIGRATAQMFADAGAKLVLVGRRAEPLESIARQIESSGGVAVSRPTDLEDGDAAAALADFAIQTFGRIDILVNNAGNSSRVRSFRWVTPEEWESVFRVNVNAVYRLTQACLPDMLSRGEGTVITVSSMAALKPGGVGGAPYSAAKAASLNLTQGLAEELRAAGIRATAVIPAETDTPILEGRAKIPSSDARKLMMKPEDVASVILLCATLPPRAMIEQVVLSPTKPRDMGEELEAARTKPAEISDISS